jgi:hypothetical protein
MSEFLKACWDNHKSPDDFYLEFLTFSLDQQNQIFFHLMQICGDDSTKNSTLLSYLIIVFQKDLITTVNRLDLQNLSHVISFLRIIKRSGDFIFTTIPIFSPASSLCALRTLEICSSAPKISIVKKALAKLSLSQIFSVILAASRILCHDELLRVRKALPDSFSSCIQNQLLREAVFMDAAESVSHRRLQPKFFWKLASNLRIWLPGIRLLNFCGNDFIFGLFISITRTFLCSPTLIDGFLLTTIFPLLFIKIEMNEHVDAIRYSEPVTPAMVSHVFDFIEQNGVFKGIEFTRADIEARFSFIPEYIKTSDILETALQFPLFCAKVPDIIAEHLFLADGQTVHILCDQIENNLIDFIYLLTRMNKIVSFALEIQKIILKTLSDEIFQNLFCLFLGVLKLSWRKGSTNTRTTIMNSMNKFDPIFTTILKALFIMDDDHVPQPLPFSAVRKTCSPVHRMSLFYEFLFSATPAEVDRICIALRAYPYLFAPLMIWATKTQSPMFFNFIGSKFPKERLYTFLFHQTIILITRPVSYPLFEQPDYDVLYELISSQIDPFLSMIIMQFSVRRMISLDITETIECIVICWRAYLKRYGAKTFIDSLYTRLLQTPLFLTRPDAEGSSLMPISYIVSMACDDDPELLFALLKETLTLIDKIEVVSQAENIAMMCFVLVLSGYDEWERRFDYLFATIHGLTTQDFQAATPIASFILTLLKSAIYTPEMGERVPLKFYQVFMNRREWKCAVDFFCIKRSTKPLF